MADQEETKPAEIPDGAPAPPTDAAEPPSASDAMEKPKQVDQVNPNKKRKVALFLSYVGHGYQGMQRNPGCKTIEEDLFKAIAAAGGISEANADEKGFSKVRKNLVNYTKNPLYLRLPFSLAMHQQGHIIFALLLLKPFLVLTIVLFLFTFSQIHFMRAARTDKGVSAVGQVCSLMMVIHPPGVVERINANLPPQIRVYGYKRAVKGFDARKACDKRRYEYILPAWMFDPAMKGIVKPGTRYAAWLEENGGEDGDAAAMPAADKDIIPSFLVPDGEEKSKSSNGIGAIGDDSLGDAAAELAAEIEDEAAQPQPEGAVTAEEAAAADAAPSVPYGSTSTFQFDQSCVDRLTSILKQYEGTHNFHNFTIRMPASAPQAKRYILSFKCDGVFEVNGMPWVRMVVIGQSFILHQIRKMVGMALAEFRGVAPEGSLKYALGTLQDVATPMAPDLGLFLDECYYDAYNDRWSRQNDALRLDDWSDDVAAFKKEQLYPALARRDEVENVNAMWLRGLADSNYKFSQWLVRPDAEKSVQKATNAYSNAPGKRSAAEREQQGAEEEWHPEEAKKPKVEAKIAGKVNASLQAEYSD